MKYFEYTAQVKKGAKLKNGVPAHTRAQPTDRGFVMINETSAKWHNDRAWQTGMLYILDELNPGNLSEEDLEKELLKETEINTVKKKTDVNIADLKKSDNKITKALKNQKK